MSIVSVFTTDSQTEQPLSINDAVTIVQIDGLLTIESQRREKGYRYSSFHRFTESEWAHYEVTNG